MKSRDGSAGHGVWSETAAPRRDASARRGVSGLLVASCALLLSGAVAPQTAPPPPARNPVKIAALARDPRLLPQAAPDRWRDFDPDRLTAADVPAALGDARRALEAGDVPIAIAALQATLEAQPDFPPALHELGVLYFRLQRYGDALVCFQRFLQVVPGRVGETRGLGHALYSLGRYDEAFAHYQRVVAAAPADVEARRGLALARYRRGDSEGALADLDVVLESSPEHADAWVWKAQVLSDLDRVEPALAAAERARDLAPWSPRPWFVLSSVLQDLGKPEEARAARERFQRLAAADQQVQRIETRLEYEPQDLGSRRILVETLASVGDRPSVRTQLARLLQQRPGDVPLRIFALDVLDGLGDVEAGRLAARDLERVGADSAAAWKRLEAWYAKTRDRTKQIEAGERWRRLSRD